MTARTAVLASCFVLLAGFARADSLHVRLVGEYTMTGNYAWSVDAAGDYAYVANGDTLRVISVVDPTHPVEVGSCGSLGWARGVAVSGKYVYVADCDSSLRVISVADPTHPVEVGKCPIPNKAVPVVVAGDYAYVGSQDFGLRVISVADPARPTEVGSCGAYYAYNLAVMGSYVYVAAGHGQLRVISAVDAAHPVQVGYYYPSSGEILAVAVQGAYAYVGVTDTTFRVVSVADPANPVEVGICSYHGYGAAPQGVAVARDYAFLGTWGGGLRVIDIADPAHPMEVGHYAGFASWSVALDRDYVYFTVDSTLEILQFYQLGDLDIDNDSLGVTNDTLRLRDWTMASGDSLERVVGEFILANTSAAYNPDTVDGPSVSPLDSLRVTGSLSGPGGIIDSIVIPNLPSQLAQGQTMVCTLTAYVPVGLKDGDYTGSIYISGRDTANLQVYESCYVFLSKLGDIDVDNDSLDVVADTIRARPRLVSAGPPSVYTDDALGEFILVNTSASYNPDTADGPSRSTVRSLRFAASLSGPRGTIDSVDIRHFPESLELGQAVVCTLAAYVPPELPDGDYSGPIVVSRLDSLEPPLAETVYARVTKLGDLDVDGDSLDVVHDTMTMHLQPVYPPRGKATFVLVNTSSSDNPDAGDGPSQSKLKQVKVKVEEQSRTLDSVYVLNLPESLAVGQTVTCTLALVLPDSAAADDYGGWVAVSATDTLGYVVRDSFFLVVRSPEPRQNLDSLRVAPIPFKPYQNPEHDAVHFQGLTSGAKVVVYDASGQSVWSATETGDGHLKWDAKVASGIYVYLVVTQDGESKVGKLSVIR